MKTEDYTGGDAFQTEKRTVFSGDWLPLCAEAQIGRPGDFLAASVGGWSVFGVRDGEGVVRVLRNACRHQNMQVVGTPSGNCQSFRCRFHGWTYDLQGRFLSAPAPVAPKDLQSTDLHLANLACTTVSGLVFFSLGSSAAAPELGGDLPAYGGTLATDIGCNWKVCVEHLLAEHGPSSDLLWRWPLLAVRRAGALAIVEQIVPHTFLRTRLFTHVFGGAVEEHTPAVGLIKQACEQLQADRTAGTACASDGALIVDFHRRLASAYAQEPAAT
ncbi:Rieske (2Fe-2S) protein [Reyranella sp.]|uniref:aromatic ring-hydroxylating oxygenase subunit alpha n=1 Tax=Reyranella sp. TaxID=1929291 RepID=UPI0025FA2E51|nr:Rieske (2Fe-2S) protein [Reyranella sp.]